MLVTALNPHIGYEKAAQISLLAYREDLSQGCCAQARLSHRRAARQMGTAQGHDQFADK
jgi:fumarate hydratase class II